MFVSPSICQAFNFLQHYRAETVISHDSGDGSLSIPTGAQALMNLHVQEAAPSSSIAMLNSHALIHIQMKGAIGVDVLVKQRCESSPICRLHHLHLFGVRQNTLQKKCINIDKTYLE
jgi:hypothetical protein